MPFRNNNFKSDQYYLLLLFLFEQDSILTFHGCFQILLQVFVCNSYADAYFAK